MYKRLIQDGYSFSKLRKACKLFILNVILSKK